MHGSPTTGGSPQADGGAGSVATSPIIDLYVDALQGAINLVHADGGEIATFDSTRQAFITRASIAHARMDAALGAAARQGPGHSTSRGAPRPLPTDTSAQLPTDPPVRQADGGGDEADTQSTMALPAAVNLRAHRLGDGLIGMTGQRAEPIVMRGEDYRKHAQSATETDIHWYLAVPIFAAGALATPHPATAVIGVLAVHVRDPHWTFTQREVELLALHADRVARSMRMAELQRTHQTQAELLEILRGAGTGPSNLTHLYIRVRDVVRKLLDAPSFALVRLPPQATEVSFEVAERDGVTSAPFKLSVAKLPPWWSGVSQGKVVCVSSPERRITYPQYCIPGWGGDAPVQSLIAAPLMMGATVVGAIVAASPRADVYSPEHERLFEAAARSAAIVIENARLADEAQRSLAQAWARAQQLAALSNAILTLNVSLDLEKTLQTLANQAAQLTAAQSVLVFLLDEEGKHLVGHALGERAPGPDSSRRSVADISIPVGWRDLDTVVKNEQFLLLDHLETEWREQTSIGRLLAEQEISSCLVVPIMRSENAPGLRKPGALGVLMVFTPGQQRPFPPHQISQNISQLQGLAIQAASAINNAKLYQDLQDALERQKELDRLKDEFILTISHEFRTPLTAIEGYVSLISRHGEKLDQPKIDQFAGEIRQSTSQLASMINMIADANRLSSEPLQVTLGSVNAYQAAAQAVANQAPDAKDRIQIEFAEDLAVYADAHRLPMVFSNLLGNAIKYAPEGKISLTARIAPRETLAHEQRAHTDSALTADQWVVLGVQDHGPGIAAEDREKLFRKFVRLTRSLTTSVRGTGLGLWICHEYIDAMGGDIWVESALGAGAHFQFCLPIALTVDTPRAGGRTR